jgi:2-polyprenyl-3-methyl-5-hydroxy-6-metoxy-1,4-benzoquinol methylase
VGTRGVAYTERLASLESVGWKRALDVQRPYRWNLRRLGLGRTLDVGCGLGRNLSALGPGSVGVDHNASSVEVARSRGLTAFTPEEFARSPAAQAGGFDALLFSHVIEHMDAPSAESLVAAYLPYLRPAGAVAFICPQERGYAHDATHVRFTDFEALLQLAATMGLEAERQHSFPFPRVFGRLFPYNEFVVVARTR